MRVCGRTTLTITADELQRTFGYVPPAGYRPRYNIAPTQNLLAIAKRDEDAGFREFRWGLVPFWANDIHIGNRLINARAETVSTKAAFREAFARRRCLIVADGFYEWQPSPSGRRPFWFFRPVGAFTMAGVWERWGRGPDAVESCAIVTTRANATMRPIHDRMPVIIEAGDRERWLARESSPDELLSLLEPCADDELVAQEVSRTVNSPLNDGPECIAPVPGELVLPLF